MEINFRNEIIKILNEGNKVIVNYYTHYSECDVECKIFESKEKNNSIANKFRNWWGDELCDLLSQNLAVGEGVCVNFYVENEKLYYDVHITASNCEYDTSKEEIYNDIVIQLLNEIAIENSITHFEINNIEFEIKFENKIFKIFKIYYSGKELVISDEMKISIKIEIENIFNDWSLSIAINYISFDRLIEIEPYSNFSINECFNYKFAL
jgi:hypothetical protein